ncbi:hypothetical protein AVEN_179320-1 [Araneus ventricosus]|uniref:Uncharacterized protein n=1 Tax=Araneus ventricosus TaxID=182803 RepID=A0A4Y2H000_ARAVE|nr:hypothetical protein AVEN_179320-1 [Araneus ventricosus]
MNTDEEPSQKRRQMTKERKARCLTRQSQESLDRIRAVDAAAYRRRIETKLQLNLKLAEKDRLKLITWSETVKGYTTKQFTT